MDDEPVVLRAIDVTLQRQGYRTIAVADPTRARALVGMVPIDAIVADLNLSLDDGRCFAAAMRDECRQPVVVVTGTSDFRTVAAKLGGHAPQGLLAKPFGPDELARIVGTVLRDARRARSDEHVVACELAQGMARALAVRDVETNAHAQRVALWTRRLAVEVGMDDDTRFWAEIGALLHDIGKVGVPDRILHKPGSLAPEEWEIMRGHPKLGGELLAPIHRLARAHDVVVHHHEAWNGTGYPDRLAGDAIPLAARVFSPIDAYDAMTSDRPYRAAMPHAEAMARIVSCSGEQFDPSVVAALRRIDDAEWRAVRDAVAGGVVLQCEPGDVIS